MRGEDGVESGAHGPAARDMAAAGLEPAAQGEDAAVQGEVERRCAEQVDAQRPALPLAELVELFFAEPFGLWKVRGGSRFRQGLAGNLCELLQGEEDAALVVVHAVRRQGEGGDTGLLLEDAADGAAVGSDHVGDLRGNQADKAWLQLFGSGRDVGDKPAVIAEDGVLLRQGRDEDLARFCEPARLVVCRVRRVAARRVVDDDHAAELVEGGADAEGVCRVCREDAGNVFHSREGPPNPLRRTFASMSLGVR